ncbi:transcriptional regulator family: C2H2 zinc finger [Penicillium brevicompactum]|uniref:Transcriptional regulator family: C2H2 zinc finger n=1 Tax=Penicillium brevicompactum TaxID=5074 RepID=A0A9W9R217_PENBR|nr:transcriptional regulator family: C2H2 zinc finger [Penicillium brevicompactum]
MSRENIQPPSYDGVFQPPQLAYTGNFPSYTQIYAERNDLSPSQHHGTYAQESWVPNSFHMGVGNVPAPNHNESIASPVYNDNFSYGYGQGSTTSDLLGDLNHNFPDGHQEEYYLPPAIDASYKRSFQGNSTEAFMSRDSRDDPSHMESIAVFIQCEWLRCECSGFFDRDATFFGHDTALWRHIKEKHIVPGVFKCCAPGCEMVFDRLKKLNEHSSTHSANEGQKGKQCAIGSWRCFWEDCDNKNIFNRDTSLWRHIKEKHIFPDAFKCSTPGCPKGFGRRDKRDEHSKSHDNAEKRKDKLCHSCHA